MPDAAPGRKQKGFSEEPIIRMLPEAESGECIIVQVIQQNASMKNPFVAGTEIWEAWKSVVPNLKGVSLEKTTGKMSGRTFAQAPKSCAYSCCGPHSFAIAVGARIGAWSSPRCRNRAVMTSGFFTFNSMRCFPVRIAQVMTSKAQFHRRSDAQSSRCRLVSTQRMRANASSGSPKLKSSPTRRSLAWSPRIRSVLAFGEGCCSLITCTRMRSSTSRSAR